MLRLEDLLDFFLEYPYINGPFAIAVPIVGGSLFSDEIGELTAKVASSSVT